MDNLEELSRHYVSMGGKKYGNCVACHAGEEVACFCTELNYLCLYERTGKNDTRVNSQLEGEALQYVHYLSSHNTLFIATEYNVYLLNGTTLQEILFMWNVIPKKIVALAWNPDETELVVIYSDNQMQLLHFYKDHFEVRHATDLNVPVPAAVYIGWGSPNTQFRGSKRAEIREIEEESVEGEVEGPPRISWRGNGHQFAVNLCNNGRRFIKTFDTELNPINISEPYDNLGESVSFMYAGQCIASNAVKDGVNVIVIFEKNCRVKSTFEIPENQGNVLNLKYHPHMNMLAVYSLEDQLGYLNIYVYANGIYSLKHVLFYTPNQKVCDFEWSKCLELSFTLCKLIVFTNKDIEYHTFRFVINRCPNTTLVAVVEGRNIDLHCFDAKTVPHPMKYGSITHIRPINRILFHPKSIICVALDSMLQVLLIDVHSWDKLFSSELICFWKMLPFHSILWSDTKNVQINFEHEGQVFCQDIEQDNWNLSIQTCKGVAPGILFPLNDTNCLESFTTLLGPSDNMFYFTKKILKVDVDSSVDIFFGLNSKGELSVNGTTVLIGITSIFVYENYLLLTTTDFKLQCIRIKENYKALTDNQMDLVQIYSREIEQGARIVINNNYRSQDIILVLPRGNLETVNCRLITVDIIESLLSLNEWQTAISIMNEEKMNWNVLFDLNPKRFMDSIPIFVDAAKYYRLISTIVKDFSSDSIFYENCFPNVVKEDTNKTEAIDKIVEYLTSESLTTNLLHIVAIQKKHLSIQAAIKSIKTVFTNNPNSRAFCWQALKYLRIENHFQEVLDATYMSFDLDFLLFVYENNNQDPTIYRPEIESLRKLSMLEFRFQMCVKANNYKDAVKYLVRDEKYSKKFVKAFITVHHLEAIAYKFTPTSYNHYNAIAVLYAQHLSTKKKYFEAGLIYKKISLLKEALEEYTKALDWREVICLMNALNYSIIDKQTTLLQISTDLAREKRIDEAVLVAEHYCNNYEKAIQILVKEKSFNAAINIAKIYGTTEFINEDLFPKLRNYTVALKNRIEAYRLLFRKYSARLENLRAMKKANLDAPLVGETGDVDNADVDSLFSQSTSQSRGSTSSSRNRRKEERKKTDLREGGHYEDIALIRTLHVLYTNVFGMGSEVREVCLTSGHNWTDLANTVHKSLSELQDEMKNSLGCIWHPAFLNPPELMDNAVKAIVGNKADLEPEYCIPPCDNILEWKLDIYS